MKKFQKTRGKYFRVILPGWLILVATISAVAVMPSLAQAQIITLEVPLGTFGTVSVDCGLTEWIGQVYQFLIGAIGIISATMIMLSGLRWAAAAGNQEQIGVAKEGVVNAVIGLILALTSFIIISALNPSLTTLECVSPEVLSFYDIPDAEDSNACMSATGTAGDPTCTGVEALDTTYITAGLSSTALQLRPVPKSGVEAMAKAFYDEFGKKLTINHAFRSISYQRCLYENNKGDHPAAPCTSNHNGGAAVDLPQASMTQEEYNFLACGTKATCPIASSGKTSGGSVYQRTNTNPWGWKVWNYNPDKAGTAKLMEQHHWDYPGQSSPSNACPGQC
ncbi:MAG: hypothetical protein COW24_00145 [Candidatus Kerfeldbacteria bacterium CG15_BIG_FIL_POST_REV_8_21_14_020_45_12]|uniref:D-alanyl-D-alanine carboxypeptidase-like core domain-containing protein n=1 Tax=Candidatus Kerfeldbacteria bacterium CG15_BIG_FIL_POST_REV_8_21_14_020_45_12 TaxID=2014247 RepID=A0A2M7H5E9_9BACT|nr:MAG: hypothetical protein COW24_00145 [Candidatus Kerfeldbacteria bacterium CG15_BIG_FIL_POST_REV_8_21_14_020_45_12]PJA92899.1 MAG: hypothetical protein CO132_05905 [Candidatus Kerfeldbacteria bacterium CG_4_9_14_3_um_filter_45_8]